MTSVLLITGIASVLVTVFIGILISIDNDSAKNNVVSELRKMSDD